MYKQINYLARKMSSIRTSRVCSRQQNPEEAAVYRALDEIIDKIYRNEVKNDQISLVSEKLQEIDLSMKEIKKSILTSLLSASSNYESTVNAAERKIIKARK